MFIYPIPAKIESGERFFDYSDRTVIAAAVGPDTILRDAILRRVARERETSGRGITVTAGAARRPLAVLELEPELGREEFRIFTGPEHASVSAGGAPGLVYGLDTFLKIVSDNPARVPELEISDRPDIPRRGYMLDISRCKVPTMDELRRLIDTLAELRCNELQLYTEHTFAFEGDERVWYDSSPMTPEEIMELDSYCRARFIELVPNLNSFGHLERWLGLPEYAGLAESPEPWYFEAVDAFYQGTLRPDEKALEFVDGLYRRMLPNFSSSTLNIGCDETVELGKGRSAALCAEKGTATVYLEFLTRLAELAGKYGKKIQFWGDIIMKSPELIPQLPGGITALEWGYEADHPFEKDCACFAASGVPFYVCPGTSAWNTFTGRTGNMLENIAGACLHGSRAGCAGMLLTDWGDNGHHQYWPISWPGICFAMGCAWNVHAAAEHRRLLPEAVGRFFDPRARGGALGAALLELGSIYEEFPKSVCRNAAVWCHLFYREPSSRVAVEMLKQTDSDMTRRALKRLRAWRKKLAVRPPTSDALILDELANGALMTECALNYLLKREGGRVDLRAWRDAMAAVIGEHSRLWLRRNRPGGLHESSERLRKIRERL